MGATLVFARGRGYVAARSASRSLRRAKQGKTKAGSNFGFSVAGRALKTERGPNGETIITKFECDYVALGLKPPDREGEAYVVNVDRDQMRALSQHLFAMGGDK